MSIQINSLQSFYKSVKSENSELVGNNNLILLSPDVIEEESGFNLRDYENPETIAHIEKLAEAWRRGDQMPPLEVTVRNGHCYVRDGHCRLRAAHLARTRGASIRRIAVIELKGNDDLANVRLLTSNDSLKLTKIQRARGYLRLRNFGWNDAEISRSVGTTDTTVRETIRLLALPAPLQKFIEDGVVAPHLALKMFRDHGTDCINIVQEAYDRQLSVLSSMDGNAVKTAEEHSTPENHDNASPASPPPQIRIQAKHFRKRSRPLSRVFSREIGPAVSELRTHMEAAVPDANTATIAVNLPISLYENLLKLSASMYSEKKEPDGVDKDEKQLDLVP